MAYSIFGTMAGGDISDMSQYATKWDLHAGLASIKADVDNKVKKSNGELSLKSIHSTDKFVVRLGDTEVMSFGKESGDKLITVSEDLLMGGHFVSNLHDPSSEQDAATKNYVDSALHRMKCNAGYIPHISANINETGFVASASSELSSDYIAAN